MVTFRSGKKIVVKIGTNLLFDKGKVRQENFENIVKSVIKSRDDKIIIVSSGAVALGRESLKVRCKHEDDIIRNICASVGQTELMRHFISHFSYHNAKAGQILLTQNELSNRETYLRVKEVLEGMIKNKVVPIINENDAVKSQNNKFRDNDHLAIKVASKIEADLLIILTNVSGVYDSDPRESNDAKLMTEFAKEDLTRIRIGKRNGVNSLGGMKSKVESALLCSQLGIPTIIANGNEPDIISKIIEGFGTGTFFKTEDRLNSKKRWVMLTKERGAIDIDKGAFDALKANKSLLAVGITSVEGEFSVNDVISIKHEGKTVAKAIVECNSEVLSFIKSKRTEEIKTVIKDYLCVAKHENIAFMGD